MLTSGAVDDCAQALRLDGCAALTNRSMVGIASMGGRLRQLALLGLQHVSDGSLMAALAQLPMLQVSHGDRTHQQVHLGPSCVPKGCMLCETCHSTVCCR